MSENKRFAVYLTPANKKVVALLEVVEIKGQDERLVWKSEWKGRLLPLEVYVANDGGNVVTVNEMGRAGYGDHVLCFFNSGGLIKNYSMVEILHLPKNTDDFDLMELVPHSMTSRLWDEHSTKVLDRNSGRLHFCIWLGLFKRWVAWDATNGKEVKPDDKMTGRWNAKARLLSIKRAMEGSYGWTPDEEEAPFMFLAWLKRPEDRKVIEQLLSDKQFHTSRYSGEGFRYAQLSSKRAFAERLLAEWDGKPTESADPSGLGRPIYYYLGVIEGQVKLPEVPKIGDGVLWIFLVPNKVEKSRCPKDPPIHRLAWSDPILCTTCY